jgi:CDP-diacylglycerol--glycerol-3-phosphate 3-phosphatidyltransferase
MWLKERRARIDFMTPRVEQATISLILGGVTTIIFVAIGLPSYGPLERRSFVAAAALTWLALIFSFTKLRRELSSLGEKGAAEISGATWVTIARGFLIALVAGFGASRSAAEGALWAPAVLYAAAAIADRVDGALARGSSSETTLGAKLDVVTDALGLFVAPLAGVRWGRLPPWYLALACAYPAFRLALEVRRRNGRPIFVDRLRRDPRARFFAGVQMTVVAVALFPVLSRALTWTAATLAMLPTLALFVGEWRIVTGSAPDGGAHAERLHA